MNVIMGILSTGEKQTNPEWAAKKLEGMKLEQMQLQEEIATLKDRYPEMAAHVARIGAIIRSVPVALQPDTKADEPDAAADAKAVWLVIESGIGLAANNRHDSL